MNVFAALREEFPNNWMEDLEVFGINPRAFETQHSFTGNDAETEVARVVRNLFEMSPDVKVSRVTVSFSPRLAENDFGGTITISGTF